MRWPAPLLAASLVVGCGNPGQAPGAAPAASASGSASPVVAGAPDAAALARLRTAEQRRLASGVDEAAARDRDPRIRIAAARALARIGGAPSRPGLLRALDDEHPEVVTWAAYGLSFACDDAREAVGSALAARAVSLAGPAADDARPFAAIARAIGKCAAGTSEATLAAWLGAPGARGRAAALGLAELASAQKRLREETLASLLQAAQGTVAEKPSPEALVPIGRLEAVPPSVRTRLAEVGEGRLGDAGPLRLHVIKALARAGEPAAKSLRAVVEDGATYTPSERAEAARGLARLKRDGADALEGAVTTLARGATAETASAIDPRWAVLPLAVGSLERPGAAREALAALAALPVPADLAPARARRLAHVRCAAARVLAGSDAGDAILLACDPTRGWIGELALVAVLDRGQLEGPRRGRWEALLGARAARTREAALELLGSHREVEGTAAIIATALGAAEPGVVGTAAELVAKHPFLASAPAKRTGKGATRREKDAKPGARPAAAGPGDEEPAAGPIDPRVTRALVAALGRAAGEDDAELIGALADAAGALAVGEARPSLEPLCRHPVPDVRRRVAAAIGLLDRKPHTCPVPAEGVGEPAELARLLAATTRVALTTDVGELTIELDPALAPVAATRLAELVKKGYFDGKIVHRVVPGFVAQLGAPHADGWGGADDAPPLRCETSPLPFDRHVVGMALAGRDTGSSQLFVTLARHPHLDGGYAVVGRADGPWESLAEGDVVSAAKLVE